LDRADVLTREAEVAIAALRDTMGRSTAAKKFSSEIDVAAVGPLRGT